MGYSQVPSVLVLLQPMKRRSVGGYGRSVKERKKERRKERRKEGKKERKKEGKKERRKEGKKDMGRGRRRI